MAKEYRLGIEATLEAIGGKWKPLILCHLGNGPQRPGELSRKICGITQKMLTQQLRELERDGIVQRTVYAEVPPRVEYSITPTGKSLREVLLTMSEWSESQIQARQSRGEDVALLNNDHRGYLQY
jgi:DNA-binding HxlR family transcriptional regulator